MVADSGTLDELRRQTVEGLSALVPSNVTAWNEVDPTTNKMTNPAIWPLPARFPGGSPEAGGAIFAAHADQHPVLQRYIRTGDGRPYAISDFYSQAQFHDTALYSEFYLPLGVEDQVAFELPSPSLVVAITLNGDWQEFSLRDRMLLNLLRPYLVQGVRNIMASERLLGILGALQQRIEAYGEGIVLVDRRDCVEYASPNATTILARWFGRWKYPELPGGLPDDLHDHDTAQQPKAPPWPLTLRRHGLQLTIRRLPVPDATSVALLVTERAIDVSPSTVLARLGLTPRQAQVLDMAIGGVTNARIAVDLNIAVGTVETHMTTALAKLGVESRTAAANLIYQAITTERTNSEAGRAAADPLLL